MYLYRKAMKEFWNQRYGADMSSYAYGEAPNAYFAAQLSRFPGTELLLPLEGEGRNGVYAAKQGWQVDAFDFSESGQKKAFQLADQHKVAINYQLASVDNFPFPHQTYDLVGLFFAHLPPPLREMLHKSVTTSLRPGGHVILEAFSPKQLGLSSGGPKNVAMLYDEVMLKADFENLHILELESTSTTLHEGPFHEGHAEVIRMIAQKV